MFDFWIRCCFVLETPSSAYYTTCTFQLTAVSNDRDFAKGITYCGISFNVVPGGFMAIISFECMFPVLNLHLDGRQSLIHRARIGSIEVVDGGGRVQLLTDVA